MKRVLFLLLILFTSACKNNVSNSDSSVVDNQPVSDCTLTDTKAPVLGGSISFEVEATVNDSPEFTFESATDNCELSHYEVSIGYTTGSTEILDSLNIGLNTTYTVENLDLKYSDVYYLSIKAIDKAGNESGVLSSSSFQVFTPKTLTNMVLWLDASRLDKVLDNEGDDANSTNFSGDVKSWLDISESTSVHDFVKEGQGFPQFDVSKRGISFSGNQELMGTADHVDINTGTINQRNLTAVFKTSDDTSSRQVIYEEGGSVRGINIYIENNQVKCGFWNDTNDGDGKQAYVDVAATIATETLYVVSLIFDYSHFVDANSAPGTVECVVNKASAGVVDSTSRLHAHSGDIGIGGMNNDSYYSDGVGNGDGVYFDGIFYELLMYNKAHSEQEVEKLHELLLKKWN
jgi:hypothetical protein